MSWHARAAHGGPVPVEDTGGPEEVLDAYLEAASGAISPNTERALRADVHVFCAWCRRRRTAPLPASPETLVAFIDEMTTSRTPATTRRYLSSITTVQKELGETSPLENASVRFALQRMHRRRGRRQTQVHGLTWPLRNRLLEATTDQLIDARNRAVLAVGYDTLLRRSELIALRVARFRRAGARSSVHCLGFGIAFERSSYHCTLAVPNTRWSAVPAPSRMPNTGLCRRSASTPSCRLSRPCSRTPTP